MHKFIIMGVQGCGKGTQARLLQQDFDLVHISVGEIFRWHIQAHTKVGTHVQPYLARGELVPDAVVQGIVRERLELHDWNFGFVLDGFPRNRAQAEFFLERYDVDAVIHIDAPDEVVVARVLARRLCSRCGRDYNLLRQRPATPDCCDACGGRLVAREDDQPEAVRARLQDYRTKTAPILELFRRKERVVETDGSRDIDAAQADIRRQLGLAAAAAPSA